MELKDYYQVLGLKRDAKAEDIKKAFRKLARKFHPDVSTESDAVERMKEINEAYAVLSEQDKRAAYDELSTRPQRAQAPSGAGSWSDGGAPDASDFFHNMFGHAGRARGSSEFRMRGEDLHARIDIALHDAYAGAVREVSVRTPALEQDGLLRTHQHVLNVQVPRGVRAGQHIRLQGQGGPGFGGAAAGDLFLEVQFLPQAGLKIDGTDVYQSLAVTPWEAALGATIDIDTPSGRIQVTVPPESQAGRKLRLKGRGIPAAQAGSLFLVLEVVLPVPTDDAKRAVYLAMAREMAFNPRQNKEVQA